MGTMKTTTTQIKLAVSSVKLFMGSDCPGFNANLLINGVTCAFVIDDGNGGQNDFQWLQTSEAQTLRGLFEDYVAAQPPENFEGMSLTVDADMVVGKLISQYEGAKKFKRILKTKTAFRLLDDSEDTYRTVGVPSSDPRGVAYLEKKYGKGKFILITEVA